jgi:hypothetical protein
MVTLPTVVIPGYAEAIRKETKLRDTAFLDGLDLICGIEVLPLSLRRLNWLEAARNGWVVACRFDDAQEMLAHALQVIWFCTPGFVPPATPVYSFWRSFHEGRRERAFFRRVLRYGPAPQITAEIEAWLHDAFMDAPASGGPS